MNKTSQGPMVHSDYNFSMTNTENMILNNRDINKSTSNKFNKHDIQSENQTQCLILLIMKNSKFVCQKISTKNHYSYLFNVLNCKINDWTGLKELFCILEQRALLVYYV